MNSKDRKKRKKRLFEVQNGLCFHCKKPMNLTKKSKGNPRQCTLDHYPIPRYLGGTFCWNNLVAACRKCNNEDYNPDPQKASFVTLGRETTMLHSVRKLFSHQSEGSTIRAIIESNTPKHTQDVLRLQNRSNWLVFLYCDMQSDHPRAVDKADVVWEGYTKQHYSMWRNDLGKLSHPVIFDFDKRLSTVSHNKIRGQIVRMRTDRLIKLDGERQNGVQFKRVRVQIAVPHFMMVPDKSHTSILRKDTYHKGDYVPVPCETLVWTWMYVGQPDFWLEDLRKVSKIKVNRADGRRNDQSLLVLTDKVVSSVPRYLPNNENNEPYYYFSPTDYPT